MVTVQLRARLITRQGSFDLVRTIELPCPPVAGMLLLGVSNSPAGDDSSEDVVRAVSWDQKAQVLTAYLEPDDYRAEEDDFWTKKRVLQRVYRDWKLVIPDRGKGTPKTRSRQLKRPRSTTAKRRAQTRASTPPQAYPNPQAVSASPQR